MRIFIRVASFGPIVVGGFLFVLAGLNPFQDARWMLDLAGILGGFMVVVGGVAYTIFSPMLANCPVSIQVLNDELILTLPSGKVVRYGRSNPTVSFDILKRVPGGSPSTPAFVLRTVRRAVPQEITPEGIEVLANVARSWGLPVNEAQDNTASDRSIVIQVRAAPASY
ncbi:MAG: DNA-binding protein [Thermoplasmata archaeon]